jgi:hypothetical protein
MIMKLVEPISQHSISRAADEAVKLWALASAQYPKGHDPILNLATGIILEVVSVFALNARRALDILPKGEKFRLAQPRWQWTPRNDSELVDDLRDALNRIIHAQKLNVGFEELPPHMAVISGGALVVPYVQASTDQRKLAYIDPFALSHSFLYGAFPKLISLVKSESSH